MIGIELVYVGLLDLEHIAGSLEEQKESFDWPEEQLDVVAQNENANVVERPEERGDVVALSGKREKDDACPVN